MVLPDTILADLPKNRWAFRDHTILKLGPADVRKLTITRAGTTEILEPDESGAPNRWRMKKPVDAAADTRSVTRRSPRYRACAERASSPIRKRDVKPYGLDNPLLEIAWDSDRPSRLKLGASIPRTANYYAALDDEPYIFTLKGESLKPFEAEFHDRVVMSFPLAKAERIVMNWGWPKRTVAIRHRVPSPKGQLEWVDEPGADAAGIDISGAGALVKALSHMETIRYLQYDGLIPRIRACTGRAWWSRLSLVRMSRPGRCASVTRSTGPWCSRRWGRATPGRCSCCQRCRGTR